MAGASSGEDPTNDGQVCFVRLPTVSSNPWRRMDRANGDCCSFHTRLASPNPCVSVETCGTERGSTTADNITNVLKIEFYCGRGAIAVSLVLPEPQYEETTAYCHFRREPSTKDGHGYAR